MKLNSLALYKKYLRLQASRELYTIQQAAFRLNISRNEFQSEFIDKGKVNVLFRNGRQFVTDESIKQYLREQAQVKNSNVMLSLSKHDVTLRRAQCDTKRRSA